MNKNSNFKIKDALKQDIQFPPFCQIRPYNILLTGSTGFIGTRLLDLLVSKGYTVKALSRKSLQDKQNVKFVKGDLFNPVELQSVMTGIDIAFYLVHSMEGDKKHWKEFAMREKIQAQNFLQAAINAGIKRIIYLGGLVNEELELSPHMKSRKEVGDILASSSIPVTQLRASLIIGAGGGSYAMLRYLVERLQIMVCPRWVKSLAQPIAVDDVMRYLIGCMENQETTGRTFDIGGSEQLTYLELMRLYSSYLNRNLFVIEIPFLTTRLSSYWVDLITPVKSSLARPLIDSLVHDTVVKDDSITKIIPFHLKSLRESIDIATKEMKKNSSLEKSFENKIEFIINQKLLLMSLFVMSVVGTTYWFDDRYAVYEPLWLSVFGLWVVIIMSSILFIHNKTRLGYLIAGILAWVTLGFWLFDNYYVVFHDSIIGIESNLQMTIRNFIGVGIAIVTIVVSHNMFHKMHSSQFKG